MTGAGGPLHITGMTRRPVQRAAAWLMAVLLALVVGEPLRAHACPIHFAGIEAAAQDAHADHAGHGAAATHGGAPADADGERPPCDCLGQCGLAALVALPGARTTAVEAREVVVAPPASTSPALVALAREHLLPFANGPPTLG